MKPSRWLAFLLLPALLGGPGPARAGFAFRLATPAGVDMDHLRVGQTFDVAVEVAFDPGRAISYLHLAEYFDGTLLELVRVASGDAIPAQGTFIGNGSLTSFEFDYGGAEPIATPGTLAVFTLAAIGVGNGTLTLGSPFAFGPATSDPPDFAGLNRTFAIAASVPGPPSLVLGLVAAATAGLVGCRRPAVAAGGHRSGAESLDNPPNMAQVRIGGLANRCHPAAAGRIDPAGPTPADPVWGGTLGCALS